MTGIIKTDQIQGAGSSTVTIPTGNTLAVTDNATIGGTLGVTDSATAGNLTVGTDALHTDAANDRVGVGGVTAPTSRLDVGGSQSVNGLTLRSGDVNNSSNGGKQIILGFNGSTSYSHAIRTRHNSSSNSNNAFYFDVWSSSQSASDIGNRNVAIFDGLGVNFPNQPFVTFQGNSNGNTTIGNGERFGATDDGNPAFNTAPQKGGIQGITYNSANGQFTIPTAGRYLIFFQGYYNGGAAQCRISLYINNIQMALDHNNSMVGTQQLHYLGNCSANDYIDFRQISGGAQAWYMGTNHMLGYITLLN
tara:strand:+ start:1185 stop:2099 length:915 start_codon:yes stop_codon:yes gene_type:complete